MFVMSGQVLQRLLENQLYVKAEKCEFHRCSVPFLGFVISAGAIEMDKQKVRAATGLNRQPAVRCNAFWDLLISIGGLSETTAGWLPLSLPLPQHQFSLSGHLLRRELFKISRGGLPLLPS